MIGSTSTAPRRILIVDDEASIRFAVTQYFTAYGYDVDAAPSKEAAEALLATVRYGIVIADLRLSGPQGTEGLDLIRYVRDHCSGTHIVLMTAHGSPEIERAAHHGGAAAVLNKPMALPQVAQVVSRLLGGTS